MKRRRNNVTRCTGTQRPPARGDDAELFRRTVGAVRPLEHDRVAPHRTLPPPRPLAPRPPDHPATDLGLVEQVEADESLEFHRAGVQLRALRRLGRGRFTVEDDLDLHGLFSLAAKRALSDFLRRAREHGRRCVRVVHGKGRGSRTGPVLKSRVGGWLREDPAVLAYCSARPADGGTGALYVLLRAGPSAAAAADGGR